MPLALLQLVTSETGVKPQNLHLIKSAESRKGTGRLHLTRPPYIPLAHSLLQQGLQLHGCDAQSGTWLDPTHPGDWSAKLRSENLCGRFKATKDLGIQRLHTHNTRRGFKTPIAPPQHVIICMMEAPSSLWGPEWYLPRRQHTAFSEKPHAQDHTEDKV